jgi:uncharacterized membrane protein HdeD (DUF308 family)
MNIHLSDGLLDIIFGVIILIQPKFLAWIIALWLIIRGVLALGIIRF